MSPSFLRLGDGLVGQIVDPLQRLAIQFVIAVLSQPDIGVPLDLFHDGEQHDLAHSAPHFLLLLHGGLVVLRLVRLGYQQVALLERIQDLLATLSLEAGNSTVDLDGFVNLNRDRLAHSLVLSVQNWTPSQAVVNWSRMRVPCSVFTSSRPSSR